MMNKIAAVLEGVNIGGFILGLSLSDIYTLFGIISFAISILSGILVIFLKVKKALADGKLSDDEIKELIDDIEHLKEEVKEKK